MGLITILQCTIMQHLRPGYAEKYIDKYTVQGDCLIRLFTIVKSKIKQA